MAQHTSTGDFTYSPDGQAEFAEWTTSESSEALLGPEFSCKISEIESIELKQVEVIPQWKLYLKYFVYPLPFLMALPVVIYVVTYVIFEVLLREGTVRPLSYYFEETKNLLFVMYGIPAALGILSTGYGIGESTHKVVLVANLHGKEKALREDRYCLRYEEASIAHMKKLKEHIDHLVFGTPEANS